MSLVIEKMDEAGTGRARIAQLSAVDSDGDTYAPGAFNWKDGGGQWVQILPAHDRRAMPLGKAWVFEEDGWAVADFTLNTQTQSGKEWHETLKFDLAKGNPIQEWSYGFGIVDAVNEQRDGQRVQVLKRLDVHEISPVVRGAGVGTRTLAIKELKEGKVAALLAGLGELEQAIAADPAHLSATGLKQLGDIHASLGRVLAVPADLLEKDRQLADTALAGYLQHQIRSHLPT